MIGTDLFSLATVALTFAGSFGKSDMPADHPERKKTAGSSSFLDFDFIKSGAKAYVASRDKKSKPFKTTEFPKTRSVDELTNPRTITATPVNRPIGYANPDVQNAMRALANSSNRDMIRLMPVDIVQPVKRQTKTMNIGSSTLGRIE